MRTGLFRAEKLMGFLLLFAMGLLLQGLSPSSAFAQGDWVDVSNNFEVQASNPKRNRRTGEAEVVLTVANTGADFSGALRLRFLEMDPAGLVIKGHVPGADSAVALLLPPDLKAGERVQLRVVFLDTADAQFSFETAVETLDTIAPRATFIWPEPGAEDVVRNTRLRLKFDERLDTASVNGDTFKLFRVTGPDSREPVPGDASVIGDGTHVRFQLNLPMANNFAYEVEIDGIMDLAGNAIAPLFYGFTSGTERDDERPLFENILPANDAVDVPTNGRVVLRFSEPVDVATINESTLYVFPRPVEGGQFTYSQDWRTVIFTPKPQLSVGRRHSLNTSSSITDLAGNRIGFLNHDFVTAFDTDEAPPRLLATTIEPGAKDVSRRARFVFRFDEPVSVFEDTELTLTRNGLPVAAPQFVRLDATGTVVSINTFGPFPALDNNVLRFDRVSDLGGNVTQLDFVAPFTTGTALDDRITPQVVAVSPQDNSFPVDTVFEVLYDEPLDPALVFDGSVVLEPRFQSDVVPGTVELLEGNRLVRFTPDEPLASGVAYDLRIGIDVAIETIQGEPAQRLSRFNMVALPAETAPTRLAQISIPQGATDVPPNARVSLAFDGALNAVCSALATAQYTSDSEVIPATLERLEDHVLSVVPSRGLEPNTAYEVSVDGLCALNRASLATVTSQFSTGTETDAQRPFLFATFPNPVDGPIPVDSEIALVFSESVDAARFGSVEVTALVNGRQQAVSGEFVVEGNRLSFTPADVLPGGTQISIDGSLYYDYAGNRAFFPRRFFVTEPSVDTTPPKIISVSPKDGSVDVATTTPIVISFDEAIDVTSLTTSSFSIWSGGQTFRVSTFRSLDDRSIRLEAVLPPGQLVVVAVNPTVRDANGNALGEWFFTRLTTAEASTLFERPRVTGQWPMAGSSLVTYEDVHRVQFYLSAPLDLATLEGSVFVAADGLPLEGRFESRADGKVIEFLSDQPLPSNTLLTTFLRDTARDTQGRAFLNYDGDFFVSGLGDEPGEPRVITVSPSSRQNEVPTNTQVVLRYARPVNPLLLDPQNIYFVRDEIFQPREPVSVTTDFSEDFTVVTLTPDEVLRPRTRYRFSVPGFFSSEFTTGDGPDDRPPQVLAFGPRSGATNVPLNTFFSVTYDEPINYASIALDDKTSVMFSIFGRGFQYQRPDVLLPPETLVRETFPVVQDLVGLPSNPQTTEFMTGTDVGPRQLELVSFTPVGSRFGGQGLDPIPTNSVFRLTFSSSLDPGVDFAGRVRLRGPLGEVPYALSLTNGDKTLEITPLSPLAVGSRHTLDLQDVRDQAGNTSDVTLYFTTDFFSDVSPPELVESSIRDGFVGMPLNPRLRFLFSEALDLADVEAALVDDNGNSLPVTVLLDDALKLVTLVPSRLLAEDTAYTVSLRGIGDLTGNAYEPEIQLGFETAGALDVEGPDILVAAPALDSSGFGQPTDVPLNSRFEFLFTEPLDAVSVATAGISLRDFTTFVEADISVSLSADGRTLLVLPDEPLRPEEDYDLFLSGLTDLAGNPDQTPFGGSLAYQTGSDVDISPPEILDVSIPEGATDVSVSSRVVLTTNDQLSVLCVIGGVQLLAQPGSVRVPADVSLDRGAIVLAPQSLLQPSTQYTFTVSRLCDLAGNESPGTTISFTTSSSTTPDIVAPTLVSVAPGPGAEPVSATRPVILTFSEAVSLTAFDDIRVSVNGEVFTGLVEREGNRIVITPSEDLPADASFEVEIGGVTDTSGNAFGGADALVFTLSGTVDTTPPAVVGITPANGASEVNPNASVMIQFSEPLLTSSLTEGRVFLWGGTGPYLPNYLLTRDKTTIVIPGAGQTGRVAAIVVPGAQDLAGNAMTDWFASVYSVAPEAGANSFAEIMEFPTSTTTRNRVDRILLTSNRRIDAATLDGNFFVSFQGVLVAGQVQLLADGHLLEFVPDSPIEEQGVVTVFLGDGVLDILGTRLRDLTYSFNVAPPFVDRPGFGFVGTNPASGAVNVPVNTTLQLDFGEPVAAETVSTDSVELRVSATGQIVPATVVLRNFDNIIEVSPTQPLDPATRYQLLVAGSVTDLGGARIVFGPGGISFTTQSSPQPDLMGPVVVATSPPAGASNVSPNALIRVEYSEPVNQAVLPPELAEGALFSQNGRTVYYRVPELFLPQDTAVSLSLPAVTDIAGNAVAPTLLSFETSATLDFASPVATEVTPFDQAENVPVNTDLSLLFDEPLDPVLVSDSTITLQPVFGSGFIPLSVTLVDENRRIVAVPQQPLAEGTRYRWRTTEIRDISGNNAFASFDSFNFTTGPGSDTRAPELVASSLDVGPVIAPLNARLEFEFDEPVVELRYGTDVLVRDASGALAPFTLLRFNGDRSFSLQTTSFLEPFATYEVVFANVIDASGNRAVAPAAGLTFSTSSFVAQRNFSTRPSENIPSNSQQVPTDTVIEFRTEAGFDPFYDVFAGATLRDLNTFEDIPLDFSLSDGNRLLTFTPRQPLQPGTWYQFSGLSFPEPRDLAGFDVRLERFSFFTAFD